jgi:hypothetical protein
MKDLVHRTTKHRTATLPFALFEGPPKRPVQVGVRPVQVLSISVSGCKPNERIAVTRTGRFRSFDLQWTGPTSS